MKSAVSVCPQLERITLIIPKLSQVRPGDLILRSNDQGATHVGIVVRTDFDSLTESSSVQDYMNSIYLVSVSRSLRQVCLARWGNPAGGFGGFSLEPGKYHARRLLKKSATGELNAAAVKPEWELLDESKVKLRSYYPPETEVPRGAYKIVPDETDLTGDEALAANDESILKKLVAGEIGSYTNHYYHRELPTTSFSYRTDQRLYPIGNRAVVTQLSGWRNREDNVVDEDGEPIQDTEGNDIIYHYINYHTGVDFSRDPALGNDEQKDVFLAPEDGIFYIWRSNSWRTPGEIPVYSGDKNQQGTIAAHSSYSYGYMGILITRPDNPESGRIYLFAHMGGSGQPTTEVLFNAEQLADYTDGPLDPTLPEGQTDFSWIKGAEVPIQDRFILNVKQGDSLGYVGALGAGTGKHIHMEVYEAFGSDGDKVWRRVDPLSCFDTSLYRLNSIPGFVDSYGWWSRVVGPWNQYDAARVVLTAAMSIDPLIDTTVLGSWFGTEDTYEYAQTWIKFYDDLIAEINEFNTNNGTSIRFTDLFKEDRWDLLRFYE